jgi:hypothetical protein
MSYLQTVDDAINDLKHINVSITMNLVDAPHHTSPIIDDIVPQLHTFDHILQQSQSLVPNPAHFDTARN